MSEEDTKIITKLSNKRRQLRVVENYLKQVRTAWEVDRSKNYGNPEFDLLIAVEQIQHYLSLDLNSQLREYDMELVSGLKPNKKKKCDCKCCQ